MFEMPIYKDDIGLIPGGLPQLLDFKKEKEVLERISYAFEEIREKSSDGAQKLYLHAFRKNDEGEYVDEMDASRPYSENGYTIKGAQAITPWLNQWLPIPFLHIKNANSQKDKDYKFEYGPTNWARARISQDPQDPASLRLVIAFDMQIEERGTEDYTALSQADVESEGNFRLAWRFRDNAWFMNLAWVDEWLQDLWDLYQKEKGRRGEDEEWKFEYLAHYLCFLEVLHVISAPCRVFVVRPDNRNTVNVDLILDIGNSRTTGMLIENQAQSVTKLSNSYLLQLRDMSEPENIYTDPFDTRLEFSEAYFGNYALSQRSMRRQPAFVWPSPARIGPEAARLATKSRSGKGSTGMSSPKRYLWDERDWAASWCFNTGTEEAPSVTHGPLPLLLNSSGTPLSYLNDESIKKRDAFKQQDNEIAFESFFTRSSLMMFLLVEIIEQALMTINSPGQRSRRDNENFPRRLQQIIFTVPGGMPIAEQNIYRLWARLAVEVLWEALGWEKYYKKNPQDVPRGVACDYRTNPVVRCEWDEATCTQLIFLYNEIVEKFRGDAQIFFERMGRKRDIEGQQYPSIRIAAIDIGGGTTDLSITTFKLASDAGSTPRIVAHPNFHDGFNLAGDDILRAVITEHILIAIGEALGKSGVLNPKDALSTLFGPEKVDPSQKMRNERIQFVHQIAVPVSLALLSLYEKANLYKGAQALSFKFGDCFQQPPPPPQKDKYGKPIPVELPPNPLLKALPDYTLSPMPSQAALDYVKNYVATHGKQTDFNILNVTISTQAREVNDTIADVLKNVLRDLCEVINCYNCDALLLTGRPSRWKAIVNTIYSLVPLPPGRIFPMNDYKVEGWYPFADPMGNITDPKTTVVVGAILCSLAEGQLEGFSFDSNRIALTSTARFIGEMELDGKIKKEKVWFELDPQSEEEQIQNTEIDFSGPISIGFRQLEADRWTTTRFYQLEYANEAERIKHRNLTPIKVELEFKAPKKADSFNLPSRKSDDEPDEGEFRIIAITPKGKERREHLARKPVLKARLQTLPRDDGFWMDTGIIY